MMRPRMLDRLLTRLNATTRSTRILLVCVGFILLCTAFCSFVKVSDAVLGVLFVPPAGAIIAVVGRRLRFDYGTIGIILGGLALYVAYLTYTTFGERNYDGPEQLNYIKYVAAHWRIPPAAHCFICHHPPLYYVLGAMVFTFSFRTGVIEPIVGLQVFSLAITMVLVLFAVLLVRRFTTRPWLVRLAAALIVFWPYSVHNCVRLHNDTLVGALMVVGLYFLVKWHQTSRPLDLYLAAIFAALSVLTKSNGYIMVASVMGVLAFRLIWRPARLPLAKHAGVAMLIMGLAMAAIAATKEPLPNPTLCHRFLGTACNIGRHQFVDNNPHNYLYFDLKSFLAEPYLIAEKDGSGRQYFWNHLMKSSLLGTHNKVADRETAYELNYDMAAIMNFLLVAMTAYMFIGLVSARKKKLNRFLPVAMSYAAFICFLIAFRVLIPCPHHTDFRHVFPLLVLTTIIYVRTIEYFDEQQRIMGPVGYALAAPFILLSILYFLPKYDLVMEHTTKIVPESLAAHRRIMQSGAPWDHPQNLLMEGNHYVSFDLRGARTVRKLDVSLDNNDRYQVEIFGKTETRTIVLGPTTEVAGLARYQVDVTPPVEEATKVVLHPLDGDRAYSMGHILVE